MEQIISWVKIILVYKILSAFLTELACGEKNRRMIQLFSGCLLILLVAEPAAALLNIKENIIFSLMQKFEMEQIRDIGMFIEEGDTRRNQLLLSEYTGMIEEKIAGFVEAEGLVLDHVDVRYEQDDSGAYGIGEIRVVVSRKYEQSEAARRAYDEVKRISASMEEINIKKAIAKFYKLREDNIIYEEQ